jgi:hypothetical protein
MSGEILTKNKVAICIDNRNYAKKLTPGKEYLVKSAYYGKLLIENDHGISEYIPVEKFKQKPIENQK